MKQRGVPSLIVLLVLSTASASAGDQGKQKAEYEKDQPVEMEHMDTAKAIGPQPGPDQKLPSPDNPYAGDPDAIRDGHELFNAMNCAGCHGSNAGGGMGPSLRDTAWIYGGEHPDIYNSIIEGRAHGMPQWGTKLPVDQVWKLTAYIKSLRTDLEPDPPPRNPSYPDAPVYEHTKAGDQDDEDDKEADDATAEDN